MRIFCKQLHIGARGPVHLALALCLLASLLPQNAALPRVGALRAGMVALGFIARSARVGIGLRGVALI